MTACKALLAARRAEQVALADRDRAIRAWKRAHAEVPMTRAGEALQEQLGADFAADEIAMLGLSNGTLRAVLRRR